MYSLGVEKDFPNLAIKENEKRLVYLDNAATTHKPKCVIDEIANYYSNNNANPHRGVYELADRATRIYEDAKLRVQEFVNAPKKDNIIFTKNTTEAINLIAYAYGMKFLKKDDEIVLTVSEHHANMVPWMEVAKRTGAKLVYLYPNSSGVYEKEELEKKIGKKTKLVAMAVFSNVLGIRNPVEYAVKLAHDNGAVAVIDGAQAIAHMKLDITNLDPDFFAFSAHKMYAPMGIGGLYVRDELIDEMDIFLTGGDMIVSVHEDSVSYSKGTRKFEGGTCNVEGAAGLIKAIDYLDNIGMDKIFEHERALTDYAFKALDSINIKVYGANSSDRIGIFSFNIDDIHPHDVASILDFDGITVRAGHHCAQPLMDYLKIQSCSRASIGIYNSKEDIDMLVSGIENVRRTLCS